MHKYHYTAPSSVELILKIPFEKSVINTKNVSSIAIVYG